MGEVRVLLADDHAGVRKGIRSVLERASGIRVIGEAVNGKDQVPQQLVEAIRRVADGQEGVFSRDVARAVADRRASGRREA